MLQFAYERRSAFASPASLAGFAGAMVCTFWRSDHGRDVPAGACAPGLTITSHHITSHHITSHHITSHHITSHHITSHRIASHHIASTSHYIASWTVLVGAVVVYGTEFAFVCHVIPNPPLFSASGSCSIVRQRNCVGWCHTNHHQSSSRSRQRVGGMRTTRG
jgi:hypothetical protein